MMADPPDGCLVCGGPYNKEHLNYGSSACNSCRAFFRRVYQRTRSPNFKVKHKPKNSFPIRRN